MPAALPCPPQARGRFIVGFTGTTVPPELARFVASGAAAGVVLFARNVEDTPQLIALVRAPRPLWPAAGPPPLIAIDQEGGLVQRLKPPRCPEFPLVPPMRDAAHTLGPAGLRALGLDMGARLAAVGVNLDFAPVLDVDTNPANPIIGARAFGSTPAAVLAHALPFADGLAAAGVLSCAKHFPGHGDTDLDSHLALPTLRHDLARLAAIELAPFAAAVAHGLPLVMTAHILFPALDPDAPATLSARIVPELLRGALGYDGAVISDDLEMGAIAATFTPDAIARGAVAADLDLLLVCHTLPLAEALAAALPAADPDGTQHARAAARVARLRAAARDHATTASLARLAQLPTPPASV